MAIVKKHEKSARPIIKIDNYGKVPPQDKKLEESVIGSCIWEEDKVEVAISVLKSSGVFYFEANKLVFEAIRDLYYDRKPISLITITDQCRKNGTLETIGGIHYLAQLKAEITSTAHTMQYCYILMEKYLRREMIRNCAEGQQLAFDETVDVFDVIDTVNSNMYDMSTVGMKSKPQLVKENVNVVLKTIYDQKDTKKALNGITNGFFDLNEITGGWQPSDLIILAARPGIGKTGCAINMAMNAAINNEYGGPVGFFTLEVPKAQIIKRMLSAISGVLFERINRPSRLDDREDIPRLNRAAEIIADMPILIDDTSGLKIGEFITKARHMVRKHGVKIIYIDYLQLMGGDYEGRDNREQQISKITRKLKETAKELDIPIIALSQMSRTYGKEVREPILEDLRESGAIEQDADVVMFLYRPMEKQLQEKPNMRGYVLGSIKKHRNGQNDVYVMFHCNNKLQRWVCKSSTHVAAGNKIVIDQLQPYHIAPIAGDDELTREEVPALPSSAPAPKKQATGYQTPAPYVPGEQVNGAVDDLPF